MMASSNGNIFRVTGPLCGDFTGPGEFPAHRPVTRSFDVFFDLRPDKRLSKIREAGDLRRHRGHYDVTVIKLYYTESLQKPNSSTTSLQFAFLAGKQRNNFKRNITRIVKRFVISRNDISLSKTNDVECPCFLFADSACYTFFRSPTYILITNGIWNSFCTSYMHLVFCSVSYWVAYVLKYMFTLDLLVTANYA